ncbi:MAG: DNA polymerase/3'-5' exonuclease PolX [Aliifodinibius sp.]|nr:DNA polymerase/3'-5' exonuclease PolX [Fodinibius sp.]NIV14266.1 DNA polymerase/3'-5' exonuclease PolX [Fodinibius sp.]NIY28101.1 DNA polymerase/3'-5' exonuclease PolX [Fodinibius sp.]
MDKKQIAKILKEMAILLEIKGVNPFKVRAHENAARSLEGLSDDLKDLVESGEITNIRGIGKGIADKISMLLNEGQLPEYEELKSSVPPGLIEMAKIPGVGPKKVKAVWDELGITTVEELEEACKADRLSGMKGFGARTQEKILENIEMMKKFKDRYLLSEAKLEAEVLRDALKDFSGVIRLEIAGSLRRWKETVKDIDLVVSAEDKNRMPIMNHFTSLPAVENLIGKGETKSSVVLKSGINADLRIVTDSEFPYTLHHFTGSKEHNVAMRQHAIKKGLKVSEYGLFKGEKLIACKEEADIFKKLGMAYIPPELRENYGELEAALEDSLPKLVESKDIRGIIHTHTRWSDGVHSVEEMAQACQKMGYEYLVISDHSKAAAYANGLSEERVKQQHEEIDEVNDKLKKFRVLKGIECDILGDGQLDYSDEVLSTFEVVIVSIHSRFNMSEAEATKRIIKAMENPVVAILGHPTGRLLLSRDGYPLNQHDVIDAAAELGVAIEINANPQRLDLDWRFCKYAIEKGVMLSINPDAHKIDGIADMEYGIGIARKGWVSKENVLNTSSVDRVLKFVQKRRK